MAKLVSKTYGDALFELALETNKLDVMLEEVKSISVALCESEELTRLMNHPKIVKEEKKSTLLVNPRFTNEEYTKYSFPSKNMEYMASRNSSINN